MALNISDRIKELQSRLVPLQKRIEEEIANPDRDLSLLAELRIERDRLDDRLDRLTLEARGRRDCRSLAGDEHSQQNLGRAERKHFSHSQTHVQSRTCQPAEKQFRPLRFKQRDQTERSRSAFGMRVYFMWLFAHT